MNNVSPRIVLCNGAALPKQWSQFEPLVLEYQESTGNLRNVKLALPDFVRDVFHLPDRILDLLEIAAYVFCADRQITRGDKAGMEYHGWSRLFHFVIKVRDFDFWNTPAIKERLKNALVFMTGDQTYHFTFQSGHSTPPADLFDSEIFQIQSQSNMKVILFSGGLDSLAGIVECLENSSDQVCLISHRSGQPRTAKHRINWLKHFANAIQIELNTTDSIAAYVEIELKRKHNEVVLFIHIYRLRFGARAFPKRDLCL